MDFNSIIYFLLKSYERGNVHVMILVIFEVLWALLFLGALFFGSIFSYLTAATMLWFFGYEIKTEYDQFEEDE